MLHRMVNPIKRGLDAGLVILIVLSIVTGAALFAPASVRTAQATGYYVRDEFGTAAYTNNNGSVNWASNWTETNDDNAAGAGNVLITGGRLRVLSGGDADLESVQRTVDLSTAATAALSFEYYTTGLVAGDQLAVEAYNGSTWTTLATMTGIVGATTGRRTYSLTAYRNAATQIRFRVVSGYATGRYIEFDNVEVSYVVGGTHTAASVLQTVQTYYIPVPEDQALTMLSSINGVANTYSPTYVYVSISINASGTVIYYDHWEDGFETAVNNPTQTSTQVWGDNNTANGIPPGYATDYLNAGDIIILDNKVDTTGWPAPLVLKYDGGDKIASTEAIAVTRSSWASGSGTLNGGSVEMLDTSVWGTRFDIPIDSVTNYDFTYAGLAVMASLSNTRVYSNGVQMATLAEGQSYLFNDTAHPGDTITATAPVQANLLTGDVGSSYASDWFTLYPYNLLGTSYYAPVNSEGGVNTAVYLQNPGATSITVNWTTTGGAQTPQTIAAHQAVRVVMPTTATGARFYTTDGSRFQAISVINSGGQANDWGYTLIPDNQLTQQAMVGWGVGQDPTITPATENGSPVWVMAVGSGSMNICADYNGDGQGPRTDINGYRYDQLLTLNNLERAKVYDSDGDQTGMLLYLCNGSESANNKTNKIAVAWGQDPATASAAAPGLDVGTTVPPLPNFTAIKDAELTGDTNGDGKFDVGETFEYQIRINNTGALPVPANTIVVSDIIPLYTTYVPDSTRLDSVLIPDNGAGTPFPLDNGGYLISQTLPIEGKFIVSFRVQIADSLPSATTIQNDAHVSGLSLNYNPEVQIVVDPPSKIGDRVWLDIDGDGVQDTGEPGVPGVTVELNNGSCTVGVNCPTTVTNAAGQYTFSGLADGTYTVIVRTATLPGGLTLTGDPDGCPGAACDNRHTVTLGPGTTNKPYWAADFGYQGNVSIGDFVWYDIDRDGVQDGGAEVGLDGVTVNLTWAGPDGNLATTADNLTFSTVTSSGGQYNFTGLPAGTYQVDLDETTLPGNYSLTTTDPLTLNNLAAGTNTTTADFGAAPGASIGDFVWNDLDGDGVQDAGEAGIAGVRVYGDSNNNNTYDAGEPNDITDANGGYLVTHLAPGMYAMRVDTATLPAGYTATYDLDGIGTPHEAIATVTAGQTRTDVDFGYRGSVLSIAKTSSAHGSVNPGDTITYSLAVRNNSAQSQTGIGVTDFLPAGTSYVTQSTVVNGTAYYFDDFANGDYAGQPVGSETWTTNWIEVNENDGTGAGDLRVRGADTNCPDGVGHCVRITGASTPVRSLYREANLSACTSATLSYAYRNVTTAGSIAVQIYTGGTLQRTLVTYNSGNAGNSTASFALNPAELATNTRVYLSVITTATGTQNRVYFDDVRITCAVTKDNITGGSHPDLNNGTLPNLVKLEDSFGLAPNQSMTVTFRVTVNNPVALASIDNTASVFSAQQLVAQQSSTSDLLPRSAIGDRVWYDTNNNGVQDAGEPGVSGVTVRLYDPGPDGMMGSSDDVLVATTTTNASGNYAFTDIAADTYYVEFERPTGYGFAGSHLSGNGTTDSDANTTTGQTGLVTAFAGTTNNDLDAGLANSQLDYGDLLSSYNDTILGENGARHLMGTLRLGAGIGADPEGQESPTASLDTFDDGVTRGSQNWTNGATVDINLDLQGSTASSRADVGIWIDWNNDGTFGAGEFYAFTGLTVGATNTVQLTVPASAVYTVGNTVNVRVRAFDPASLLGGSLDAGDSVGLATNGEVEDYQWNFGPTAVTLESFAARSGVDARWLYLAAMAVTLAVIGAAATWRRRRVW